MSEGRKLGVCPYYGGRSLVREADVVLAPYAVVLQPEAQQAVGLCLDGAVLVVDEAHNLVSPLAGLAGGCRARSPRDEAARPAAAQGSSVCIGFGVLRRAR